MDHAERFRAVMDFQPVDRLPRVEWATWWHETIARWTKEGLSLSEPYEGWQKRRELVPEITRGFGLDVYQQHWFRPWNEKMPAPPSHGAGLLKDEAGYDALQPALYPPVDWYDWTWKLLARYQQQQEGGEVLLWITLPGFFGWPRTLFGIHGHFLAFYDHPDLMHRMNSDVAEHTISILHRTSKVAEPVFATIGEDMSYNHGPMLSRKLFDEFLAPYYRRVVPVMKEMGLRVFVDTDGDVTEMIPWLEDVGVEGVLPLERQAGVDGMAIRAKHPHFRMIGHFDKMTMTKGEEAMRAEFERLMPLMRGGGFIPSVDHQTPPGVSLEQYHVYLRLLREYTRHAAQR